MSRKLHVYVALKVVAPEQEKRVQYIIFENETHLSPTPLIKIDGDLPDFNEIYVVVSEFHSSLPWKID